MTKQQREGGGIRSGGFGGRRSPGGEKGNAQENYTGRGGSQCRYGRSRRTRGSHHQGGLGVRISKGTVPGGDKAQGGYGGGTLKGVESLEKFQELNDRDARHVVHRS